jgi:hypothetical protein
VLLFKRMSEEFAMLGVWFVGRDVFRFLAAAEAEDADWLINNS